MLRGPDAAHADSEEGAEGKERKVWTADEGPFAAKAVGDDAEDDLGIGRK